MKCVVIVPVFKNSLNKYEEISLLQCRKIFEKYPIRILNPPNLDLDYYYNLFDGHDDFGNKEYKAGFFHSPQTYNKFLKSLDLYKSIAEYDYFLMHHTDAFVFRDELQLWMQKGFDIVGAPLYEYDHTIAPKNYIGVGNSGFSLHKVSSSIKVIKSFKKVYPISDFFTWYKKFNWKGRIKHFPYFLRMILGLGGWSHYKLNYSKLNEDIFWGIQVPQKFPDFKVAPFEEALRFSMEYNCKKLLKLNNGELPFGCHQWYKGNFLNFWKDKIEAQGYDLDS